jgi:2-amino-4-hydroxy-6-hydroxymethyldihydropteridine diphosphokinase
VGENYLVLLLGTNLGDRLENLLAAFDKLKMNFGDAILKSSIYQTAAWGKENQQAFLNQVIVFDFSEDTLQALQVILGIETELGRIRTEKWGERMIDIDILFHGSRIINESRLQVPHPYLHLRNFTLEPLKEIGEQWLHPKMVKSVLELSNECPDRLKVELFET